MSRANVVARGALCGVLACGMLLGGCASDGKAKRPTTQPVSRYPNLGLREVPEYLRGTIYELANLQDTQPFLVSGYGLVVNLRGTGDNSSIPSPVRQYMIKEMLRHKFGMYGAGYESYSPEQILRDNRTAVVRVDGYIPPGARKDDHFDVLVSALEESYTTSLSHGTLFLTDLRYRGAEPNRPGGSVNVFARATGPVFVNPAYALLGRKQIDSAAKASLRYGVVMDGGASSIDNALTLRLRAPQFSLSRMMERRINERFQDVADHRNNFGQLAMAMAKDDGIVQVFVPRAFGGNWEHFANIVKHLYMNGDPAFLASRAEMLGQAALQPDAPLENISYALEGIGQPAVSVLRKLMASDRPDVAYAAARAAVFVDEDLTDARMVLLAMAKTPAHPFRINAVRTLGELPASPETNQYLRQLINTDNALVRIEAYKSLVRNRDSLIYSKVVREKFVLDLVPSSGPPMIYASRRGIPRIALIGLHQSLTTPLIFSALDARLTLSADNPQGPITLYYRAEVGQGDAQTEVIRQASRTDMAEIIARLGGESAPDEKPLDFSYADVVALIASMKEADKISGNTMDGRPADVLLMIEEQMAFATDTTADAPMIPDAGREQGEGDQAAPQIPDGNAQSEGPAANGGKAMLRGG